MKSISDHIRSCLGVVRIPLAYIIRKIIIVQTYDDCPKYAIPNNNMIARMLHLPPDKNKLHNKQSMRLRT